MKSSNNGGNKEVALGPIHNHSRLAQILHLMYEIIVTVVLSILLVKNLILIIGIVGYRLTVVGVVMYSEAKNKFK